MSLQAGRLKLGAVRLSERKTRICGGENADELMSWQIKRPLRNMGSWCKQGGSRREQAGSRQEQGGPLEQGQGEKEGDTHAVPWQSHRDVLTAGTRDGSFPKFRFFFFPFIRGFLISQQPLVSIP